MRAIVVVLLVAALAGCTESAPTSEPVLTVSSTVESVETEAEAEPQEFASIYGVVVDDAITPISGAIVRVPGLDEDTITRSDGTFQIKNIPAGATFVRAEHPDYQAAAIEVMLQAGDFKELKLVLNSVLREPFVEVQAFTGFADTSADTFGLIGPNVCRECTFQLNIEPGAEALVLELASNRAPDVGLFFEEERFQLDAYLVGSGRTSLGWGPDPWRLEFTNGSLEKEPTVGFEVTPTDVVPQQNVEFELFAATFYNGADPDAWSIVGASE